MQKGAGRRKVENYRIRPMMVSDLDSVIHIEKLSFPNPWTRDQFTAELGRDPYSRCHVAELEDGSDSEGTGSTAVELIGFIMAWLVADELHITNLAVAPKARRSGAAAALLDAAIVEAMGLGAAWCQLEVRSSNEPARKLYRRFGFEDLGTRKGYYLDGEDAVVMGKELKGSV